MEKLSYEPYTPHFSYPHPLVLATVQSQPPMNSTVTVCSSCSLRCDGGHMYTCRICAVGQLHVRFPLHVACAQLPTLISHPSHPKHPLSLHHAPPYRGPPTFYCDGCRRPGYAFCYRCPECNFDLHPTCASKPLSTAHPRHHHQLKLKFFPPNDSRRFSCDVCGAEGQDHWLYCCSSCDFNAHLDCATSSNGGPTGRAPATSRSYQSLSRQMAPAQQMHQSRRQPARQMHRPIRQPAQQKHRPVRQPASGQQGTDNDFKNMVAQSIDNAAAQQAGQSLVQSQVGGGDNDHDVGDWGYGEDDSFDIAYAFDSILGDAFDGGDYSYDGGDYAFDGGDYSYDGGDYAYDG